jgi:stage II sporulation protein D
MPKLALSLAAALLAAAAAAPTASAAVTIDGRGWGHGIGMSQYGAYGYALRENRDATWILQHYYRGTRVERVDAPRVRVLLRRSSSQSVCSATRATDARGRRVTLRSERTYRARPAGSASLRLVDARTNRTRATLRAPVSITGGRDVCLRGGAENGLADGRYRGAMVLQRHGRAVHAVNRVHIRHYLYGVVPAEMPTSWSLEAVKAQAITARSYTHRSLRPQASHDVFADTRSQMFRGIRAETANGNRAVRETDGLVLRHGEEIAQTFYFSTSGGSTANNDEVFGGEPISYLRSVPDAHDDLSPVHRWRERLSDATAQARLRSVLRGSLRELKVVERGPSGRVLRVAVRGSRGTRTVSGATIRRLLRLRSTWFSVR